MHKNSQATQNTEQRELKLEQCSSGIKQQELKKGFQSTIKVRKHHLCYQQILKQDNAPNTDVVARVNPMIIIIAQKQWSKSRLLAVSEKN